MKQLMRSTIISTGIAMFAMFFGAGNVIFALGLGQYAGSQTTYAIAGFLLTAVLVPFLGLISVILFEGDYNAFFARVGKYAGFLLILLCMALMGPFAAMPRIIAFSHSTLKSYIPSVSLFAFSLIFVALIFACVNKKARLMDLLGYFLGPLKIFFLGLFIVAGFIWHPESLPTNHEAFGMFINGLYDGYKTLDLIASFFFSSVILISLRNSMNVHDEQGRKKAAWITFQSSIVGALLLAAVYVGFSYVSAFYSHVVAGLPVDEIFSAILPLLLGKWAALIGNITISLACFTTVITLATVFSDFVQKEIFMGKVDYLTTLIVTLVATFAMANLGFTALLTFIKPILFVLYPVFIVISVLNIAYKLWDFKPIKLPVFITAIISTLMYLW